MKTLWSKINQWYDKKMQDTETKPEPAMRKMPIMQVVFGPYRLFADNTRRALILCGIFALVLTILFLAFGQSMMCAFDNNALIERCSYDFLPYILPRLLAFVVVSAFILRYYQYSFLNKSFSWQWLAKPQLTDAKVFGVLLLFLLLNLLSVLSGYLLFIRVPNPDWRVEILYFLVVSVGFLVPFWAMRFYSVLAFICENGEIPALSRIWKDTANNGLRLIFGVGLMFCVLIFSLSAVQGHFRLVASTNTFYTDFIAEYIFNFIVLLNVVFFANYCYLQKIFLTGEK